MFRLLTVVALALLLTAYQANARTGEDLISNCSFTYPDVTDDPRGVYCLEYITGFVDSMVLVKRINGPGAALFCLPNDFTVYKALEALMRYAEANADSKSEHISVFTTRSLRTAFPCP